jgi:hypothetical protein
MMAAVKSVFAIALPLAWVHPVARPMRRSQRTAAFVASPAPSAHRRLFAGLRSAHRRDRDRHVSRPGAARLIPAIER